MKIRLALLIAAIAALEAACRTGLASSFVIIPPSAMLVRLGGLAADAGSRHDAWLTLLNVAAASVCAVLAGTLIGVALHFTPRWRRAVEPYLASYYSIPIFVFYPVFVVFFGLNRMPIVFLGFCCGIVSMINSTLDGLGRVPKVFLKTSAILRMSSGRRLRRIIIPAALPQLLAGVKFSVAYAFVGVIGAEFILATSGVGYQVAYAFNNMDNATMYGFILFILIVVSLTNLLLSIFERRLLRRRGMV